MTESGVLSYLDRELSSSIFHAEVLDKLADRFGGISLEGRTIFWKLWIT